MGAKELLAQLHDQHVRLSVREGELIVQGRRQVLQDPEIVSLIKIHKEALKAILLSIDETAITEPAEPEVPANLIAADCTRLTPGMLPLVSLTQAQIDALLTQVEGGLPNVQDIYPLAPLQEGVLFHHMASGTGDPYLQNMMLSIKHREQLDEVLGALQVVIDRHDILRTCMVWEGVPEPVQVVLRGARLVVEEVELTAPGEDAEAQLQERFDARHYRLDVRRAPMMRACIAHDASQDRWLLQLLFHHLLGDGASMRLIMAEIDQLLRGEGDRLPQALPFRDFVFRTRSGLSAEQHEAYFREVLGDVDEPTLPFGLVDVRNVYDIVEKTWPISDDLALNLRRAARAQGVSVASLFHLAWAQVLACTSGREDVVFGTVLFGRLKGDGADRTLGMFINTLPIRIHLGAMSVLDGVRATQAALLTLLEHEHASLSLAQRCSGVAAPLPLFSALLNYRHAGVRASAPATADDADILQIGQQERTNYPLALVVEDSGVGFDITVQADIQIDAERMLGYVQETLAALARALEHSPTLPLRAVEILPDTERRQLLVEWNDTRAPYAENVCLPGLVEAQVARTPDAIAVIYRDRQISYAQLNVQANRVAHFLIDAGIKVEDRVAICAERGVEMVVGMLGILKAGAAYVPLDTEWPLERSREILTRLGIDTLVTTSASLAQVRTLAWSTASLRTLCCVGDETVYDPESEISRRDVEATWDHVATREDEISAGGFISSYTGQPFSSHQVSEYLEHFVTLIEPHLTPGARVLEIGYGSGLLSFEMLRRGVSYVGLDSSRQYQQKNQSVAAAQGFDQARFEWGYAHEVERLSEPFDIIVIASTAQFFPGYQYLQSVLDASLALLADGGVLVMADLMDPDLKEAFSTSVQRYRHEHPQAASKSNFDAEFYIARRYFEHYCQTRGNGRAPAFVTRSEAGFSSELVYRYDVLIGKPVSAPAAVLGGLDIAWPLASASARQDNPLLETDAGQTAYIIFTSGSTGVPKGVVLQHRPVVNLIEWVNRFLQVNANDRLFFVTSICFDLSVYDIFGTLAAGACLDIAPADLLKDPAGLADYFMARPVTFWDSAPGTFGFLSPFLTAGPASVASQSLRAVFLSGDWIPLNMPGRIRELFPNAKIVALGGATEAAIWSNYFVVDRVERHWSSIPYGKPIQNALYHVLTEDLKLVPVGVKGDLYIAGRCLAQGYANDPVLSDQRFIQNPFGLPGERMYKTGDLTRYLPDGNLEFLGRSDHQVKIRGFRVELGEIEAQLMGHPVVREAVVLAHERSGTGKYLVAYYTLRQAADDTQPIADLSQSLRGYLLGYLPEYMVPFHFIGLQALPVTSNGKLNRQALPVPDEHFHSRGQYQAPVGVMESALAAIWMDVLRLAQVGRHDNFFSLGGHSLLAVRVISQVRETLGIEFGLNEVFSYPVLDQLALLAEQKTRSEVQRVVAVARGEVMQASFSQQRLWFMSQMDDVSLAYHISAALKLTGALDEQALRRAFDTLVARHESLRTRFALQDEQVVTRIDAAGGAALSEYDLRQSTRADAEVERLLALDAGTVFDLARGPLLRIALIRLTDHESILLLTMHHIISDGWSMGVLARELGALYQAFSEDRNLRVDPLPALPIQYADYAAWQRGALSADVLATHGAYWQDALSGAPALLDLPTDTARGPERGYEGAQLDFEIDAQTTRQLRGLSERQGVTLFMTVLSAWAVVLSKLSAQDDLVIGTPVANRNRAEVEPLIGFFVNTLALRLQLAGDPSFAQVLALTKRVVLDAHDHQDMPFEQVVELLNPPRSLAHTPLFQVMLAWQSRSELENVRFGELSIEPLDGAGRMAKFDLTLAIREEEGLSGSLEYASTLFEDATVARHIEYLRTVLLLMARDEQQTLGTLDLLSAVERRHLLVDLNPAVTSNTDPRCLQQLFEAQVARAPQAIAVAFEQDRLSYGELNRQANRLAHHLRELGVGADDRVALCVERGLEMLVGILAILKAGAGYVPLDPVYPTERLQYLLDDSRPSVVITFSHLRETLGDLSMPVLELDTQAWQWAECSEENPDVVTTPASLAYVIYTSGSTGQPKGVMVEHGNVTRLFSSTEQSFGFGPGDVWTLFHSFAFDFSVWEIWGALLHGGRLEVLSGQTVRAPELFYGVLCERGVTVLNQTPSAFRQLIAAQDERAHSLRWVIFGGEALEPGALAPWYARSNNAGTQLVNMYGITETTVHVTFRALGAGDVTAHAGRSPIGEKLKDLRVYLLDRFGQPVPFGVVGELYVGGAGVARGYLNRPELTAQRFLRDPFSDEPDARMYRTGDLARYLADGELQYLGRNDDQVKIRGFRIELGEIEAQLAACAPVREACVLAREDIPGDKRLVAYYTRHAGMSLELADLRAELSAHLPEYMVPAAYVELEKMPLTANGKLDRRALPAPDGSALTRGEYAAPIGAVEERLAEIWAEVLKVDRVGRHDNFFELGGHSLLAVSLMERMRRAGLNADVQVLFGQPSLSALALALDQAPARKQVEVPPNLIPLDCTAITPAMLPLAQLTQSEIDTITAQVEGGVANVQDIYPLAPLQEGVLFHHMASHEGDPYLQQVLLSIDSRAQLEGFVSALQSVIDRHDILRTAVLWEGLNEPMQVVLRQARLVTEEVVLSPEDGAIEAQLTARFDPRHYRLDVRQAPMLRLFVAEDAANGRWLMQVLFHHLVDDVTSMRLMIEEIELHLSGDTQQLAAPEPFRNFVAQARLGISVAEHESYFRQQLGDVDEPTLPFGIADVQGDGSEVLEERRTLDGVLAGRLRDVSQRLGVSSASLFHLAWAQVLGQVCGRDDVVFGTVLLGRLQGGAGADRVLGMFINTLPIRVRLGAIGVRDAVRQTHAALSTLLVHEHASLALAQRCSGVAAPLPLFSALLNYRHVQELEAQGAAGDDERAANGIQVLGGEERTNYPLTLSVDDRGKDFSLTVMALQAIGAQRVAEYMLLVLQSLVDALEHASHLALNTLDVLPEAERRQLLLGFNATQRPYPQDKTVHGLFEAQALVQPDTLAAICNGQQLTYRELNQRANRLAQHLIGLGVQPGERVAILLGRSLDLLVSQLAILKCAAVYVPLDINAPIDRQHFMLRDSQAVVVLSHSQEVAVPAVRRVDLDVLVLDAEAANPQRGQSAQSIAYIMYTSGSTGTPKGVLVPHRAINRLVINNGYADFNVEDRVAFAANPAFDASTLEVWAPLLNGGCVVVVEQAVLLSQALFRTLLREQSISVLWLTAGLFHQYADGLSEVFRQLRYLIVGGDVLDPGVIARVLENGAPRHLLNGYGPTEATTFTTTFEITSAGKGSIPIGRPIGNTRVYVLDRRQQPVAVGVAGELYIGGDGVAKGYLNQPELTAEKFIADPFSPDPDARLYRSGDWVRWLPEGNIEYLGRHDNQVKIRGFRIEPGEIETRLGAHDSVREAAVLVAQDSSGGKQLVAYYTLQAERTVDSQALRAYLSAQLPDYMVPAAYVQLASLPLTANGKLDRQALPVPDESAFSRVEYAAPVGETEMLLAGIWADLLKLEHVGRDDNFFALGGHSLLAVSLMERMRQAGLQADVRVLFGQPTLSALAATMGVAPRQVEVPENLIAADCTAITPAMLPLVQLTQGEIDAVVAQVEGGARNIQDIYPLAPLQEGVLFHHMASHEGDPYLLNALLRVDSRSELEGFLAALQVVVDRHDILRTAVLWEGLREPVQVVVRQARLIIEEVELSVAGGDAETQMVERFDPRHYRLDVRCAPLLRASIAEDVANGCWLLQLLYHHAVMDHTALEIIQQEIDLLLRGEAHALPAPLPFRNFVAQMRLGMSVEAHEAYFREQLAEVDEPTLAFGLLNVQGDGKRIVEAHHPLDTDLAVSVRKAAQHLGVSAASLFHLAWAQVLGQVSGRDDVVFGTVLFGRMQGGEGADRVLGMFINTLPIRIRLGQVSAHEGLRQTHQSLSSLLLHEHASLALAQRCSGVAAPLPLFSALLNYRHSAGSAKAGMAGIALVSGGDRTNYPLVLSVDDFGDDFELVVQADGQLDARRIAGYMQKALESLVHGLAQTPSVALRTLDVLPAAERQQLLVEWNPVATAAADPRCLQQLFEAQVARAPQAIAVAFEQDRLSYGELNRRANRLAHHLRELGVGADDRVALCVERGLEMLVGILAILKAGAGYVPLDPVYPTERLQYLLDDSTPSVVITFSHLRETLGDLSMPVLELDTQAWQWAECSEENPDVVTTPASLAYVIYTSGSTGQPKGVMVEHGNVTRLFSSTEQSFGFGPGDVWTLFHSFAFDFSVWEIWGALLHGGRLEVLSGQTVRAPELFYGVLCERGVTVLNQTPSAFRQLIAAQDERAHSLRWVIFGGEALEPGTLQPWYERAGNATAQLVNMYGITETTVHVTFRALSVEDARTGTGRSPIGRKLSDLRIYLLDARQQPVPLGAEGELYVGGAGVARGYLNRPELTAQRFLRDPFSEETGARMYRTGDLARYLADGELQYLGRNDDQVKIRGFRIELGEIEARLGAHEHVGEAAVLALKDSAGGQQLVGYYSVQPGRTLDVQTLRGYLSAQLPDYMVPAAYVQLDSLPLTANGKLDRRALPAPGDEAFKRGEYAAPVGETEILLATIWADVLKLARVGRHDNFFELGGHSLLAVSLMERMRQAGLNADVQVLFGQPTLSALAQALGSASARLKVEVPPNLIPLDCTAITPAMLPLAQLTQAEIDTITAQVEGGVANVQDIYPLAPLQEGVLFHHMASHEGDPYLQQVLLSIDSRAQLESFVSALQAVIDRHDILRTAVLWEGLNEPVQVVLRQARLVTEEIVLSPEDGAIEAQLTARFDPRHYRLDVRQAPMLRLFVAEDAANGRWLMQVLFHHLVDDVTSMRLMIDEIDLHLSGNLQLLPVPVAFRNFVAQARLGKSNSEHEAYFRAQLGDVDEPTLPFGLSDVQSEGHDRVEARQSVPEERVKRLRGHAQQLGVSVASLFHLAWAQVLGRVSGREDVVFGTVLFGRMQGGDGADRVLGMFINTLPIRVRLGELDVRDGVYRTHASLASLMAHEHASLALAQRCSGVVAPLPLFSALLNYRHVQAADAVVELPEGASSGVRLLGGEERTNYPLALSVDDFGQEMDLVLQADSRLDAQRLVMYMDQALIALVQALDEPVARPLRTLDILPATERDLLLRQWNDTARPYPQERCLHELFEAQVLRSPEAMAVLGEQDQISYAALNQRANRLAHYLRGLGLRPDDRVALCVERSIDMVVGMLAVLKAGAAYVPIDPGYPAERLAYMLDDCAPKAVLTQARIGVSFAGLASSVPILALDTQAGLWASASSENPERTAVGLTSRNLAYVIYTSGSTGLPKGVMLEHHTIQNLLSWYLEDLHMHSEHAVLLVTSQSFDLTQKNILGPLAVGARLYLAAEAFDPSTIARNVRDYGITHLNLSSSAFYALLDENEDNALASLRQVVVGGEPVKVNKLKLLHEPRPTLINGYGPTECSDIASCYPLTGNLDSYELSGIPIGRPIRNFRIYLLDEYDRPVPLGGIGELCIGGVGVARGYLNRGQLTAERFIADPFSEEPEARMYRSGDQARYLPDGRLEYLGRNDDQVKIRGFRIELGEVEAQLGTHPDLDQVAVLAREDVAGDKRLVAYYTVHDHASVDVPALRAYMTARVPEYMVPSALLRLAAMPLTANGKLDRRALPAPDEQASGRAGYVAPQGETEIALAQLWADLLKLERVGRHDHFFELGGHSLLAMRLVSRVRQSLGVSLDLKTLFAYPQLAAMAGQLGASAQASALPILPVSRESGLPLSFTQQRIWFLGQIEDVGTAYHINVGLSLLGRLDRVALGRALDRIVARHEALRTCFVLDDSTPLQCIAPADQGFALTCSDLRTHSSPSTALATLLEQEAERAFDLASGPLIRGCLIQLGEQEHVLRVSLHHIIADGGSMGLLMQELSALYSAFSRQQADPLPPLPLQYGDYAAWQRSQLQGAALQAQQAYWQRTLAGAPALLNLPTDRARPQVQDYLGARIAFTWDAALTQGLKALAQRQGATLFMMVLGAWAVLLGKLSGQDEVVIGTPMENRSRVELEALIGLFVNTLALRLDLSADPSVAQLLRQARHQVIEAQAHQDLPFEHVVELLQPPRSLAHTPVFQVMLAWQDFGQAEPALGDLQLEPLPVANDKAKFDLTLDVGEIDGCLGGSLEYASALFDAGTMQRHLDYLQRLLGAMVADENRGIGELDMLSAAERRQLLIERNDTTVAFAHEGCIQGAFEAQVLRAPQAVAVVQGRHEIRYGALNEQANRLAHHLRGLGVRPDDRVALCVERGIEMIVGMLAVLKAGAAYVPLDPSYPLERLAFMLQDSAPAVVLTQHGLRPRLGQIGVPVLELDTQAADWQDASTANPGTTAIGLSSANLAYVIYTSGSTGQPKGVMVEHRSVSNLLLSMQDLVHLDADDRMLALTTISFDIAGLEVYLPLSHGATLVMAGQAAGQDPAQLAALLISHDVTVMQATPSTWRMLLDNAWPGKVGLKALCGGEAFPLAYAERLLERTAALWNLYGPTETTIWSLAKRIEPGAEAAGVSDVGRAIANTRLYLLDRYAQPVPPGAVGEICIGGVGVARGYWQRPELTEARFLADPFSDEPGARLYRTGDLGRYLPDGHLEYLGRNDQQVKLRGFRLELGEIETHLGACRGVAAAAVLVREDRPGEPKLVAYYTEQEDTLEALQVAALRDHLLGLLPEYMVPAAYVKLERFPLTLNGKLDRRALPAPDHQAYGQARYAAPVGALEIQIAEVWAQVLEHEQVGRHDNLFELGGHSLLLVRLLNRLKQQGLAVGMTDFFNYPTVQSLAARLKTGTRTRSVQGLVPVRTTGSQRPLYLIHEGLGVDYYFAALARHIDADIPVYGLAGTPLYETAANTLEGIAKRLVALIRSVQPSGPYRLAGWSFGGIVAYEVAAQLIGQNEVVESVCLLDSLVPQAVPGVVRRQGSAADVEDFLGFCQQVEQMFMHRDRATQLPLRAERLEAFRAMAVEEVVRVAHQEGLLPWYLADFSAVEVMQLFERWFAHAHALEHYAFFPIPVPLYLFSAQQRPVPALATESSGDALQGWGKVVPPEQVTCIPVPGDHYSIVASDAHSLGQALNQVLCSPQQGAGPTAPLASLLLRIQQGRTAGHPVICIPGAGDSATHFISLAGALEGWHVYGLQPQGLDGLSPPHTSVEAAAQSYLQRLDAEGLTAPLHLVGHSFGGWVAFEMALRLREQGRTIASLTLIDSEVPGTNGVLGGQYTFDEVLLELVRLVELSTGRAMGVDPAELRRCEMTDKLRLLHTHMVEIGVFSKRSDPDLLKGTVRAFGAALRATWLPGERYTGPMRVVYADDALLDGTGNQQAYLKYLSGWASWAPRCQGWRGPGNHFTILKAPHVARLAQWWLAPEHQARVEIDT